MNYNRKAILKLCETHSLIPVNTTREGVADTEGNGVTSDYILIPQSQVTNLTGVQIRRKI